MRGVERRAPSEFTYLTNEILDIGYPFGNKEAAAFHRENAARRNLAVLAQSAIAVGEALRFRKPTYPLESSTSAKLKKCLDNLSYRGTARRDLDIFARRLIGWVETFLESLELPGSRSYP